MIDVFVAVMTCSQFASRVGIGMAVMVGKVEMNGKIGQKTLEWRSMKMMEEDPPYSSPYSFLTPILIQAARLNEQDNLVVT